MLVTSQMLKESLNLILKSSIDPADILSIPDRLINCGLLLIYNQPPIDERFDKAEMFWSPEFCHKNNYPPTVCNPSNPDKAGKNSFMLIARPPSTEITWLRPSRFIILEFGF